MILIETVGVGQSETVVKSMRFSFVSISSAGTNCKELSANNGMDAFVITKADGDNVPRTEVAKTQIQSALHLFRQTKTTG